MKHLFREWDRIKIDLENKFLAIFLDYDGTLTPIAQTPDRAILAQDIRVLLKKLAKMPDCKLAIISGRALAGIERLVDIKEIEYVGNHGLEIGGSAINFESLLTPRFKEIIGQIKNNLNVQLAAIEGILVEDKGLTLSIHYRLMDEQHMPRLKKILNKVIKPYLPGKEVRAGFGKKVFEIRPPVQWDKGKAILWLLKNAQYGFKKTGALPIYLGDDFTDEDAFEAIKNKGLTVRVGSAKSSHARYYLKDTEEVSQFLMRILALKGGPSICRG